MTRIANMHALTFNLKALGGSFKSSLAGAGAYCGGPPTTGCTACLSYKITVGDPDNYSC